MLVGKQQTNKWSMDGQILSSNVKSNHHGNATIVETNTDGNKQCIFIYMYFVQNQYTLYKIIMLKITGSNEPRYTLYKIIMLKITGSNEPLSHTW